MPKTEFYQITSADPVQMMQEMNRILLRLADRIDKLEGVRGTSTIQDGLTIESSQEIVHGFNTDDEV